MKTKPNLARRLMQRSSLVLLLLLSSLNPRLSTCFAQGTAFTYQGRLNNTGALANGSYDFRFKLYADPSSIAQVGSTFLTNGIPATSGLFLTTLDFGPGIFTGNSYWLEIGVRTNGGGGYTTLAPLQAVTPTPYAVFANTASNLSGTVPAGQISGALTLTQLPTGLVTNNAASLTIAGTVTANSLAGNGANVTNVNAATLNGKSAANFWQTGGNSGTTAGVNYLGTADNQPLELHINGQRALRLEYGTGFFIPGYGYSPNIIGGSVSNSVGANFDGNTGNFIGGGGSTNSPQQILGAYNAILGGLGNTIQGVASIAMGQQNSVIGSYATAMGIGNSVTGYGDTAIGGNCNSAGGAFSIAMGNGSSANGTYSMALGSFASSANDGTFVWADNEGLNNWFTSTATNQFLIRASGGVGIGTNSPTAALTVASGGNFGFPQLQLDQQAADYSRLRFLALTNSYWDIAVQNTMNFFVAGYGDVLKLQTNGVANFSSTVMAPTLSVSNATVSGLLISGTGTGTAEASNPSGVVIRHINSTTSALNSNSVVAISGGLALVRDGTYAGFQIKYPASPGYVTIACMGIDNTGAQKNFYTTLASPVTAGTVQIYANTQNIVHFECTFGITYVGGQPLTQVVLSRYGTDYFWSGNIITTYNQ